MLHKTGSTLSIALLLTLGACDGGSLSRNSAKAIIEKTPIDADASIDLGRTVFQCLQEQGFLTANMMGARLTEAGQHYFSRLKFNSLFGESGFAFVQPVQFRDVKVTGVSEPQKGQEQGGRTVEFTADYSFVGVEPDSPAAKCLALHQGPVSVTGVATKYDDGWRIEYRDIAKFNSVAM